MIIVAGRSNERKAGQASLRSLTAVGSKERLSRCMLHLQDEPPAESVPPPPELLIKTVGRVIQGTKGKIQRKVIQTTQ